MKKRLPLVIASEEGTIDGFRRQGRSQRHIPARQPFADRHEIGRHSLMLAGEHFARPSETGRHFIDDQEHIVLRTELTDPCQISGRGHHHSGCGLHQWFKDHPGKFPVPGFQ